MARGQQKIQSQQKNAEKQAKMKKQKGHDQKSAAAKALTFKCKVCMVRSSSFICTSSSSIITIIFLCAWMSAYNNICGPTKSLKNGHVGTKTTYCVVSF